MYCGYSLEPPRRGGFNMCPQFMILINDKKISNFLPKIFIFHHFEKLFILHGLVFKMKT